MKNLNVSLALLLAVTFSAVRAQYTGGIGCGYIGVRFLPVVTTGVNTTGTRPLAKLSVWPNPTSGVVMISFGATPSRLRVLDATGREVLSQGIGSNVGSVDLDLSAHACGLYMLQVRFADGTLDVERVVRE